jgi:outer membrane protein TolC
MADFDPARLNDPEAIGALGAGATLSLPLYAGGRISAGARAAGAMAGAQEATHRRQQQEIAVAVVEAYFGTQAAAEAVRHAEDLLAQAVETERFVRERTGQGLALEADLARASAFRAQAEAERAAALQRLASARSALVLLAGDEAGDAELASPVAIAAPPALAPAGALPPETRPDLEAARLERDAARAGVSASRGSLLPGLFAQASAEALGTTDLDEGTGWTTLAIVARWDLSLADARAVRAAKARAHAADEALAWRRRAAERETAEARRAIETAEARVRSAREAVTASERARDLRAARHRQGLLPLTDVLDAEAALAGARALLLGSVLETRVAGARLALALDQPIEGLVP